MSTRQRSRRTPRKIAAYLPYPTQMPANEVRQIELIREGIRQSFPTVTNPK